LSLQSIARFHDSSRVEPAGAALGSWMGLQGRWSRLYFWGYRASRTGDRVSGSLAYPAPPHDLLAVAGPGLRGIPLTSAFRGRSHGKAALMAFASPSERSWERWNRLSLVPPLVGLWPLPPMYLPRVHSGEPKLPSDRRRQVPVHVPPSWFRTTMTVCSAQELRVCCTPQPAEGSPRFVRAGRRSPEGGQRPGSVPAVRFAPSEEFPSSTAGNASLRPVAFLSLLSCPAWGAGRSR
jgi:hypothetical protein